MSSLLVFPGQGAQRPGMLQSLPEPVLEEASDALGEDVRLKGFGLDGRMAGTLALLLLGQLLFGALCDGLGWLGLARRRPSGKDALAALLVLAGALLIVLH